MVLFRGGSASELYSERKMKKITLMIPCYNEEEGIGRVIDEIPQRRLKELGYEVDVLVIDNNSSDKTVEVAKKKGARVVSEKKQGKGNAIRTGFENVKGNFVVMVDGDDTYKTKEMYRLIELLESDFCDVVIGSRLEGRMEGKAMSFSHRLANWFFTFIVRQFYGANVTDTCTGYFAWKREVVDELNGYIKSPGFAIESEMITKMAKMGFRISSVPITYAPRAGESKLSPVWDGLKITKMLIQNIFWRR
ncbi:glycosyltransferase family 2 protein [Nanoarchaeota archaeon]